VHYRETELASKPLLITIMAEANGYLTLHKVYHRPLPKPHNYRTTYGSWINLLSHSSNKKHAGHCSLYEL